MFLEKRYPGKTTIKYCEKILNNENFLNFEYDEYAGGWGGVMRCMWIGLYFDDLENIIHYSFLWCLITHPNGIALLGWFTSAYFTFLAKYKINIKKWPKMLLNILNWDITDKIINIIKNNDILFYNKFKYDKIKFINYWVLYLNKIKYIKDIPYKRIMFFHNYFSINNKNFFPGSNGFDSVIIAYDNLYLCKNNFEKFIIYNCLHLGDWDTTGIIGCSWYGAYYGYENVPLSFIWKPFECKQQLKHLIKKFYI